MSEPLTVGQILSAARWVREMVEISLAPIHGERRMRIQAGSDIWCALESFRQLRRLRSDEWLEKAAQEIAIGANQHISGRDWSAEDDDAWVLAILRKHRDG